MDAPLATLLLVIAALVPLPALLTNGPPPDPTNSSECVAAGGECLSRSGSGEPACPGWKRPFPGICGAGKDCCFTEYQNHSLQCGLFGGDCALAGSCGNAPRHENAYCERDGDVCCIWLF